MSPQAPFGFINAFKPPGPSSTAFGNWVRHLACDAAVGHWGTLDPTACGVLLLAVGKATKLLPLLPHARKQYVFELIVGAQTDTGDATGTVIATAQVASDWTRTLRAQAASFIGPQTQTAPMHSAVKIAGRPLYRSARAGVEIPRQPRATVIYDLRVLSQEAENNRARLFVECAAGTYVRVLCEELGGRLGLPAHMGALLRIAAGPFRLSEAVFPNQIAANLFDCLINPLNVLLSPRIDIDATSARRFARGNEIRIASKDVGVDWKIPPSAPDVADGDVCARVLVIHDDVLVGIGRVFPRNGADLLAPIRVFANSDEGSEA